MISSHTKSVIERSKALYEQRLKQELELQHADRFVAIEPESGDYFLADSFDGAVKLAKQKYPARLTHTIRIGQRAAFQIGAMQW